MSEQDLAIPLNRSSAQMPLDSGIEEGLSSPAPTAAPSLGFSLNLTDVLKWVFSFPAMLGTFLVGSVFYEGRLFIVDTDLWWHIKIGQDILRTHHWPTSDPYSFTVAGTPWLAYEWLGDVMIGFVARFGLQALDALLIILASTVMLSIFYLANLRAVNSKAAFVSALVLCFLAFASFTLRPQMFGYLFLVLTLIVLEHFRRGRTRALWFLPPLFLIWVNTHGSWIIGLGVILVTLATGFVDFQIGSVQAQAWTLKQRVHLELALLSALAMIPLTPYGTRLAAYPFSVASSLPVAVGAVQEWLPMSFGNIIGKLFLVALAVFFILQMLYRFTFRLSEWVLLLGGAIMACLHIRFLLLFVPFFAPLFATVIARGLPGYNREKDKFLLNGALMAGVILAMIWSFPTRKALEQITQRNFPVRAVEYLRNHPVGGHLFNSYGFGGYLIWALPEQKVFIDGRGDLYEWGGTFADYLELTYLRPAAFSELKSYGIEACLLKRDEPLATVMSERTDWKEAYSDDTSVLFVRRQHLVDKNAVPATLAQNGGE